MILVDSNVPMYLVGAPHPNKVEARLLLEQAVAADERLVTDAEVLQEILHRYVAIRRLDAIQPAIDVLLAAVDDVLPVEATDVLAARDLLLAGTPISARDALHAALMRRHEIDSILTFDTGFDRVPGMRRFGA
jgi:predicted nucleic acid-binding protein